MGSLPTRILLLFQDVIPVFALRLGVWGPSAIYINGAWTGALSHFKGLHGYWIFAASSDDDFSYQLDESSMARKVSQPQMAERPVDLEFIQSSEQAFYYLDESIIEEMNVLTGDWFVSFCGSRLAGSRQYVGATIDIPVMGYDGHYSTAGYCESGDTPQFKLFKPETSEMINLYSQTPIWESNGIVLLDNMSETAPLPSNFSMLSAYPNPFNPVTNIGFEIPEESMVKISIFDLKGQEVETLVNELTAPGLHTFNWNASNTSSGVYFVHFTASGDGFAPIAQVQKLTLIK